MAVAVTSNARRAFRIGGRPLGAAGIARAVEHFVELGFEHGVQELTGSIPQASFNRVEPVEKVHRSLSFRLRLVSYRAMARHGVISAGMKVPESLVGPSWRLCRLQIPTTPATAPGAYLH